MIIIKRVDNHNADFLLLVKELNAFLAVTDGDEHAFYDQYNQLQDIKHILVAYRDDRPLGCGAIKALDASSYEVKRMYTTIDSRGQGIAKKILSSLEAWAKELGAVQCVLETGRRQTAAIALYQSAGYQTCDNYGQYIGVANSICFSKTV